MIAAGYVCRIVGDLNNIDKDIELVMNLQKRYRQYYPGFQIKPGSFFRRNFFGEVASDNILIVIKDKNTVRDEIMGVAYLLGMNNNTGYKIDEFIIDIIVEPAAGKPQLIYDKLYRRLIVWIKRERKRQPCILCGQNVRRIILTAGKEACETAGIDYFKRRDFSLHQTRIFMQQDIDKIKQQRSLSATELTAKRLTVRRWKLETKSEQFKYLRARNEVFAETPLTSEDLRWFLSVFKSDIGTAVSVFDWKGEVAGSLMVYRAQNNKGIIEDLFVLPTWRRQGMAAYLLAEACSYLKDNEIDLIALEIDGDNEPAFRFYKKANFKIMAEELYLTHKL